MNEKEKTNYDRIEEAIGYITTHFQSQPGLDEVAEKIHLSPFHFQRLFTDWAGVSPKKFLQYISLEHAKNILKEQKASLFDAAFETGLSGTGRLHDLFINIEGMTPGEYKNGGENLLINHSFAESPFGNILVALLQKASAIWPLLMMKRKHWKPCKKIFRMPTTSKWSILFSKMLCTFSRTTGKILTK